MARVRQNGESSLINSVIRDQTGWGAITSCLPVSQDRSTWRVVAYRFYIVYRQSPLGPVDPSCRALSGRLKFTVRRHKFNKGSLSETGILDERDGHPKP